MIYIQYIDSDSIFSRHCLTWSLFSVVDFSFILLPSKYRRKCSHFYRFLWKEKKIQKRSKMMKKKSIKSIKSGINFSWQTKFLHFYTFTNPIRLHRNQNKLKISAIISLIAHGCIKKIATKSLNEKYLQPKKFTHTHYLFNTHVLFLLVQSIFWPAQF